MNDLYKVIEAMYDCITQTDEVTKLEATIVNENGQGTTQVTMLLEYDYITLQLNLREILKINFQNSEDILQLNIESEEDSSAISCLIRVIANNYR